MFMFLLVTMAKKKKIRRDGFHGDYLTVSFCEGLNTVTAIRGFLYAVSKAQADILWAQAKPTVSHACRLRAPKGGGDLWLCFLLGFSSLASAQSTCYQNKQKPLCDRNVQLSPGVEQEAAYGPGSPHLASAEANLPSSPRALEALECSSNSRYSILL